MSFYLPSLLTLHFALHATTLSSHEPHGLIPNTTWIPCLASLVWLGFWLSGELALQPVMHLTNI